MTGRRRLAEGRTMKDRYVHLRLAGALLIVLLAWPAASPADGARRLGEGPRLQPRYLQNMGYPIAPLQPAFAAPGSAYGMLPTNGPTPRVISPPPQYWTTVSDGTGVHMVWTGPPWLANSPAYA